VPSVYPKKTKKIRIGEYELGKEKNYAGAREKAKREHRHDGDKWKKTSPDLPPVRNKEWPCP